VFHVEMMPSVWMTPGAQNLPGSQNPNAGLMVRFHMGGLINSERSLKEGAPKYDSVPFITIAVPGDKTLLVDRPVRLDESDLESEIHRFPELWAKFKRGEAEDVSTGTPLTEWPPISRAQVEEMAYQHVRTVEQLAAMSDVNCQRVGSGSIQLRQKARDWLQQAEKAAPFLAMKQEMSELKGENESLRQMLEQTNAKLAELIPQKPAQTKPSIRNKAD
jgi:hypothetical protein